MGRKLFTKEELANLECKVSKSNLDGVIEFVDTVRKKYQTENPPEKDILNFQQYPRELNSHLGYNVFTAPYGKEYEFDDIKLVELGLL